MSPNNLSRTFLLLTAMVLTANAVWCAGDESSAAADAAAADAAAADAVTPSHTQTFLSDVYSIDQLYRAMKGPQSLQEIRIGDGETTELLWITGYKAVMVGADGEQPMPQDFMCHSNLDVDSAHHRKTVGASAGFSPRLFTLSQGQLEIELPEGFGIPFLSSETLRLTTQVLNLNFKRKHFEVRHKISIEYVRDSEAVRPMIALFPVGAYGLASLEEGSSHYGVSTPDDETHGPGCLPGQNAAGHTYKDTLGHAFTGHWVVKPGREVNTTLVTRLMALPYDTTVHYIAVHLHPFAESLELRDRSLDETIFKSEVRNFKRKIGLESVEYFSSTEGLSLFRGHEFEMVSVYNNITDEDQDSMAVMYLYLRDRQFKKGRVQLGRGAI
jgi:hypothetical protein